MRTRAYRRHQRARIKARHLHDFYTLTSAYFPPPGDIAVRHPLDCGRSRCHCCHGDKLMGVPLARYDRRLDKDDPMLLD